MSGNLTRLGFTATLALLAASILLSGCHADPGRRDYSGSTMGTYYRVSVVCSGIEPPMIEAELAAVNAEMSNYDPDSVLSQLNGAQIGEWVAISDQMLQLLAYAQQLHGLSQGAFDITIAPVLALWGFGPNAQPIAAAPTASALQVAAAQVDMAGLELRSEPAAARRRSDIVLDLSALAKGHGVDRVAQRLEASGCQRYLVDIGGEVRGRGQPTAQRSWRIGIEVPDSSSMGAVQRVVRLEGQSVATSGDYRNFVRLEAGDGTNGSQHWSHTIDPRTARPVAHKLASVSVVAPTAMAADAWATALNVLGPEDGLALAKQQGLAALFITRTDSGFEERYTAPFEASLEP